MGKNSFLVCGFLKQKAKRSQHEETTARNNGKRIESDFPGFPMSHVQPSGIRVSFGEKVSD